MRLTLGNLQFLFVAAIFIICAQSVLSAPDPCMAVCCSRGWLFYGSGNFSKLGVNGSSDCNCFDSPLFKCSVERRQHPHQRIEIESIRWERRRHTEEETDRMEENDLLAPPADNHCTSACCNTGSVDYGYGDMARLGECNCAMQPSSQCSTP